MAVESWPWPHQPTKPVTSARDDGRRGASTPGDQIRVITAQSPGPPSVTTVPAPAGVLLALVGAAGLGLGRVVRRRFR